MEIKKKLELIVSELPETVKLVAVSKTKPASAILEFYQVGQKIFGENKAQEMAAKYNELPKDIEWHFIGHLQSNKVKYIAPFVSCIHSVDSISLLEEINKKAESNGRIIDCLLQMYISTEATKFGMDKEDLNNFIGDSKLPVFKNINITGVMGMASFTDDLEQIKKEFKSLKSTFEFLKQNYFNGNSNFKEISMGMSGDYKMAIAEGSTMVRIGSTLFGER